MNADHDPGELKYIYPDSSTDRAAVPIDERTLLAIGRLVRGVAELENCVDSFVMMLAEINEVRAGILLGRQGINAKIQVCEKLAKARDDQATAHFEKVFTKNLLFLIKVRNVVAHGRYMGKSREEAYMFMSSEAHLSDDSQFGFSVYGYRSEALERYAELISDAIPKIEKVLQIEELRARHLEEPIRPHPKAQKQKPKKKM